ncbi:MAG: 4,4'-diaponeurosporenoate glycosyltransferase [Crocinitomicaceae bacterium]|jgi:4,4'-diaponeurosporenoate glycosyltransferase
MLVILPILATLCAISVLLILGRPRYLAKIPDSKKHGEDIPTISIIVPARDEEANIPALLESLQSEIKSIHEVIIVDDASTDRTAQLSIDGGAMVNASQPLPEGWNGKPWACHQGATTATGDWLLFLDADVRLHPGALKKLNNLISQENTNTAYSVYPHHIIDQPYEQLSAYFNALMVAGVNTFGYSSSSGQNSALFGQTFLIPKKLYFESEGHAAVKDKVLENFHLAKILKSKGAHCSCYLGKDLVSMRMFPNGFNELWASWKKGFVGGAAKVEKSVLIYSSLFISAGMFSIISLCFLGSSYAPANYSIYVLIGYIANALACAWAFKIGGSFSILNALTFPISLIFYQTLFFKALIDARLGKKTNWKGRMVN